MVQRRVRVVRKYGQWGRTGYLRRREAFYEVGFSAEEAGDLARRNETLGTDEIQELIRARQEYIREQMARTGETIDIIRGRLGIIYEAENDEEIIYEEDQP